MPAKGHDGWARQKRRIRTSWRHRVKRLVHDAKHRSRAKGYDYDLDIDWVYDQADEMKKNPVCAVTGLGLELDPKDGVRGQHPTSPSIDKLDPKKGYTKRNTRIVSWWLNCAKGQLPEHEFAKLIIWAAEHYAAKYPHHVTDELKEAVNGRTIPLRTIH